MSEYDYLVYDKIIDFGFSEPDLEHCYICGEHPQECQCGPEIGPCLICSCRTDLEDGLCGECSTKIDRAVIKVDREIELAGDI